MSRLQRTLKSCLPSELCSEDNLCITSLDGRKWQEVGENGTFDKVSLKFTLNAFVLLLSISEHTMNHSDHLWF